MGSTFSTLSSSENGAHNQAIKFKDHHTLGFVRSLLSVRMLWLLYKNWLVSFAEKWGPSRVKFLEDDHRLSVKWWKNEWCLITGSGSGICKQVALILAQQGINLVLPVRDMRSGEHAKTELMCAALQQGFNIQVVLIQCDLTNFASVRDCVESIKTQELPIRMMVLGAGEITQRYTLTPNNNEAQFQIMLLSHFLMIENLWDVLYRHGPSKIIWVTSDLHRCGKITFPNLQATSNFYSSLQAYCDTKLAIILMVEEINRRSLSANVSINSVDPGAASTNILRNFSGFSVLQILSKLFLKSPHKAAEDVVCPLLHPAFQHASGCYFSGGKITKPRNVHNSSTKITLFDYTVGLVQPFLTQKKDSSMFFCSPFKPPQKLAGNFLSGSSKQ